MAVFDTGDAGVVLAGMLLFGIGTAHARVTAAQKCEAAKLSVAGKHDLCRLVVQAKAVKSGVLPDFSQCDAAYSAKWSQTEMNAGGMCPSNGDACKVQGTNARAPDPVYPASAIAS